MSKPVLSVKNCEDTIYGEYIDWMNVIMMQLTKMIEEGALKIQEKTGMNPVEHLKYRIKSDASMREKCMRMHLPVTTESALFKINDGIGLRVICPFLDDVYAIRDYIETLDGIEVITSKDYIKNVKPNGYRSYHMIVKTGGLHAEIQIRTISMDTWATLEHHMRYKKDIHGNKELIFEELKRCADELASTDASMQTIRFMINDEE